MPTKSHMEKTPTHAGNTLVSPSSTHIGILYYLKEVQVYIKYQIGSIIHTPCVL